MTRYHTQAEFETFLSQLLPTNAKLDFYADFQKISANVEKVSIKLHQLNYLLGHPDMEKAVRNLWDKDPEVFSVLSILIAVRKREGKKVLGSDGQVYLIESFFKSPEGVLEYLEGTGLKEILQHRQVSNLVDYVFGIETGLDSHARKNRSGTLMEKAVADVFAQNGISYRQQVKSTEFPSMYCLVEDTKVFDFVLTGKRKTYLLEANFYSGGGSKLNEVARAYSEIAPKVNQVEGFEFVWVTDGIGWLSAKSKLEEAFYNIPRVYNLTTLPQFIAMLKE